MTNTIYIHQPEKAFSFTRLPNFLFEAPTFQPLSNEAKVLYTEIKTIYLHSFHSNPIRDIFGGKTRRKGMEWGKEFNGTTRNFAI